MGDVNVDKMPIEQSFRQTWVVDELGFLLARRAAIEAYERQRA